MSIATGTQTVMVIAPNRDADEVAITPGMTVGQLAAQIGLSNPTSARALDEMQRSLNAGDTIGPEVEALSFVVKLAGAR